MHKYMQLVYVCAFWYLFMHNKIVENACFVDENAHIIKKDFVIIDERGCGREEKSVQID